jgi:hypothetical protein
MQSTVSNHVSAGVETSEKLIYRLMDIRDRLSGSGGNSDKVSPPPQVAGVLAMASTVHSNVVVAHKVLDEIEQLIG